MADTELSEAGPVAAPGADTAAQDSAAAKAPAAAGPPATEETVEPATETGPAEPDARPAGGIEQQAILRGTGVSLLLLAFIVLSFAGYLYGLSGVQESRAQTIAYTRLQSELAQVLGASSPLDPRMALGSPMALLDIPGIGMRDLVVVQGTSPENLRAGPGHLPDTSFPGQPGVSVIYGRRATFGAPFGRIAELRAGGTIKAITGQGSFTYRVAAVADSTKTIEDPAPNRLLLLTASSSVIPTRYLQVDADLVSSVASGPGVTASISASELPMAGDGGALVLTMVWGLALVMISAGGTIAAVRWSPWVAYLITVPLVLAVLLNLYQNLAALLPNLY